MKRVRITRGSVGIAVALATVIAFASPATAASGDSAEEAEFVAAAVELAGLSAADAEEAWSDPEIRETIPVSFEVESWEETRPASATELQRVRATGAVVTAAATKQKTWTVKRKYHNFLGVELFNLSVTKTFTYNGTRAWHGTTRHVPWINPLMGWNFDILSIRTDEYAPISGVSNRVSVSERAGRFETAAPEIGGIRATVGIVMEGRYTGSVTSSTWQA